MKRFISFNLTLILLAVMMIIPLTVRAEENGVCGENVTWTLKDDGTLVISGTGRMKSYYGGESKAPWSSLGTDIKNIVVEEGVTYVSSCEFNLCDNLTEVTIPASVTDIELEAFSGCEKLVAVNVDADNEKYLSVDGVVYSKEMKNLWIYPAGKPDDTYVIPDSVYSIEFAAFSKSQNIKNVVIPEGCTFIGNYVFSNCTNLKTVVIPKKAYWIGVGAFSNCTGLTDVYYTGSEQEWNSEFSEVQGNGTYIDWDNDCLLNANVHYNCVNQNTEVTNKDEITVMLDNEKIEFDVPPQIINERTMVPMRAIFVSLGATVEWDGKTRTVTSKKDDTTIILTIDDANMYVNDRVVELDSPACIVDERTLVPVRAISEAFDLEVLWNGKTRTVHINTNAN